MLLKDIDDELKTCRQCHTVEDPYIDPETPQGSIIAKNPKDFLCIDYIKVDPS